ncbi:penicillin acylase family protein [Flagellimonas nanhaiensis]|uniref:Acylase n=1 Tax=Flagellimonas nanhaiensis TaxID=2292706 RepID=A0A371JLM8_9FLAO|nr:penicillin acylase family protein [Allomuricauda nanhaiensis]RDY57897.1 hypothetical protein DX873_17260 [Allomuricauda nanhaiensis]
MSRSKLFVVFLLSTILIMALYFYCGNDEDNVTIVWDNWGVPHIKASDEKNLFYGFGYSQMEAHGNKILKLYGKSRGNASEYWGGEENYNNDLLVKKLGVKTRSQNWLVTMDAKTRDLLTLFVHGINDYCRKNEEEIDDELKIILPIDETDVLSHLQVSYHLMVGAFSLQSESNNWKSAGSNAWALGPQKTESGNAMLLVQPHPPWFDNYLFFESHLMSKKLNLYGIAPIGLPLIAMGFNESLGWGMTFNQANAMDLIEVELKEGQYRIQKEWHPLETSKDTILNPIKKTHEIIEVKRTNLGYIIEEKEDKALVLRLSGFDRPNFIKQFFDMGNSTNLDEFQNATKQLQLPLQNIVYADKYGDIFYLYNGIIPKRQESSYQDWSGIILSDELNVEFEEYVEYEDLPKIINPKSGFLANSNDGPFTSTFPLPQFHNEFPGYIIEKPFTYFGPRSRQSIKMITAKDKLSFKDVINFQASTHLEIADRTIDELINYGINSAEQVLQEAATVLMLWDRSMEPGSKGAVLFINWYNLARKAGTIFENGFDSNDILNTPNTLTLNAKEQLLKAAKNVVSTHGKMDISTGQVYKIEYSGKEFDGGLGLGELGAFNAGFYMPTDDNKYKLLGGTAFSLVVEFGDRIKAKGILSYGNTTNKRLEFHNNQLELLLDGGLRDVYYYEEELRDNINKVESLIIKD